MPLSASTLAIFLLLVPGLVFRYLVYQGSLVKRPLLPSNALYSSISIILYSTLIILSFVVLADAAAFALGLFSGYQVPVTFAEVGDRFYVVHHTSMYSVSNFLILYKYKAIIVFVLICFYSAACAYAVQWISRRNEPIGRVMYGPLAPIISRAETALVTCFVLTKIAHEGRRLVYAGYPLEVSLRDGSIIDHLVLGNPAKFYLLLEERMPATSFADARPISTMALNESYMYISGSEIENVHFEGFYFPA